MLARELKGFHAVARLKRPVAVRIQQVMEELHIQLVILND